MGTAIVILVILVIIILAVRGSLKHMKGEGGCCGGGASYTEETRELEGSVVAKKIIYIEGMHCDNCKNSVTRQLQKIDGVAAKVNLKKNLAVVTMDREVSDEELTDAVIRADFKVIRIEKAEV